eukprot:jgi/Undpi1/5298/HiC_scaffold_2.g00579.m1
MCNDCVETIVSKGWSGVIRMFMAFSVLGLEELLEDSTFHCQLCNDCVATLTYESPSGGPRTFKKFGVPGRGKGGANDATGDNNNDKGIPVALGNGVVVTTKTVEVEDAGDGEGGTRGDLPVPLGLEVWKARREKRKAASMTAASDAAAAVAPTAAMGDTVTDADAAGGAVTGGVAAGASTSRGGDAAAAAATAPPATGVLAQALTAATAVMAKFVSAPANVGDMGAGTGSRGVCTGPGSTAPNSPEEPMQFFSEDQNSEDSASLTLASRTSSDSDVVAAAAACLQTLSPPKPQRAGETLTGGVRAKAQALERKLAGVNEDLPNESPKPVFSIASRAESCGSETLFGGLVSHYSSGVVGNSVVGGNGGFTQPRGEWDLGEGNREHMAANCNGGGGIGHEDQGESEKEAKTGGGWGRWALCGVAAVGVGVVGVAVWAYGGRPSRR